MKLKQIYINVNGYIKKQMYEIVNNKAVIDGQKRDATFSCDY